MPERLCMVGLAWTVSVSMDRLEVYNSSWSSVMLLLNKHVRAPFYRIIDRNTFKDTKANVTLQALLDLFLPVYWNGGWREGSYRFCILIHK